MRSEHVTTPLEQARTGRARSGQASASSNGHRTLEKQDQGRSSPRMEIGLSGATRAAVNRILSHALADATVLSTKTRNFHWNVTGPEFIELHRLFDGQYEALSKDADEIAERIRKLGGVAPGSMAEFIDLTCLKESPGAKGEAEDMVSELLADHETVIRGLRKNVTACQEEHKDAGTADFLTGLMLKHEANAWMLRSLLE